MVRTSPAQAAATYLRELLERPGSYRQRWERRATRPRAQELNQRAIGKVLAHKLWDDGHDLDERSLKDRVARALRGEVLSPETLELFITAFDIAGPDADRLWALLSGTAPSRVVAGELAVPPEYPSNREAREYRTVSLHEFHQLGADGSPAEHRTVHVIEALQDDLRRYPYRFDTDELTVEVVRGGAAGPIYRFNETLYAVDILFTHPLKQGETASWEYRTIFHYAIPPKTEFRRAVFRRLESLQIRVEFHPNKLPASVWWAEWEALDGPVVQQELVTLDSERAVHRYLQAVERAIVGFRWEW